MTETETKPMLPFPEAIKSCLRQYARFSGRATRAEYWWWVLGYVAVSFLLIIIEGIIVGFETDSSAGLSSLFALATLLPWLAVTARRLHDIGRTGWWQGLVSIPAFISVLISLIIGVGDFSKAIVVSFAVVSLIFFGFWIGLSVWLIWRLTTQGQAGPNQYGPDPRA